MHTPKRPGRPAKRPTNNNKTTITIRITGTTKNQLLDQAEAYDLTLSEYITTLIQREEDATQTN